MNDKDVFKYGEDIFNSINRAAETGNFSNLSRDVRDTINGAANSFLDSIKRGVSSWRKDTRTPFFSVRVKKKQGQRQNSRWFNYFFFCTDEPYFSKFIADSI